MLNPTHLQTLLEVIRLGSFAAAANRLGYTASAVSQQMSALEKDAGVQLFDRSAHNARPTEAAAVMAHHSPKVLNAISALVTAVARAHSVSRHELSLGAFASLATELMPALAASPSWQRLDVTLQTFIGEPSRLVQRLQGGSELDVALVYQVGQTGLAWPSSVQSRFLGRDEYRFVLPAAWGFAPGEVIAPTQLSGMPWITHIPGTSDAAAIKRLFAASHFRPHIVANSDDVHTTLRMVASGTAGSFVPLLTLQTIPDGIVVPSVPTIHLARELFALVVGDRAGSHTEQLLDEVAQILRGLGVPAEQH
ncbi:DNA-binding transcriptional LysR family regulator [Microbacterium sp. W4I4]|uniref:LysR family transcriptional regulator n=1 Tax=Microbacterium sp. W4I4 TaxID=3042295 RepID=UPI00277FB609|nr:LysR family transcriptional regulator [Microbacterium sp. W4I4]MDQ0613082.1 DNA-binding transcriptional LysR family regulator [Microbacterium sp. W4I4]